MKSSKTRRKSKLCFKSVPKLQELHGGSVSARGPGRSGIDFGRKVNPTSVATAREAARYLDPTNKKYIYNLWALSRSANGIRQFTAISTILARTGGGKFGNKICSRQLDRARCQKRLLILYRASSISCQVLIRPRIRRGWMLFNIQRDCPSKLMFKKQSTKTAGRSILKN